ncbi:MAG: hypothetical protein M3310_07800 [Actinomycetota bacterium]|nr:hypothetical protein [Actinomycetota bacterium]
MNGRRLSQAISEGDGISVLVAVDGPEAARAAADAGADAVVVADDAAARVRAIREATELPLVVFLGEDAAVPAEADACVVALRERDRGRLGEIRGLATDACELVIRIASEEDLEFALEELDPEILVLGAPEDDEARLAGVLDLLPDVPAGKLAVADFAARTRAEVEELERAGVDGVIVVAEDIAHLVAAAPPDV